MFQILTHLATTDKLQRFRGQLRFEVTFYNHPVNSPCSERSQLEQVVHNLPQSDFEISKDRCFHSLSGQHFQCLIILTIKKKAFSVLKWSFPYFSLYFTYCLLSFHWALMGSIWLSTHYLVPLFYPPNQKIFPNVFPSYILCPLILPMYFATEDKGLALTSL